MSLNGLRPAALLWDLDGTLADTHPLIHRCVDETFQEFFGRSYDESLWRRSVGHPLTVVFQEGFKVYDLDCDDTAPMIRFYRERLAAYEGEVKPFAGVVETVRALALRGFRQGVVTTKFGEAAARHLETLGLTDSFEVVITGDNCARHKPDPAPFIQAIQALGLPPADCIMIGDSAADIIGARAAGLRCVAALWGSLDVDAVYSARPDFMVRQPENILTLIRSSA